MSELTKIHTARVLHDGWEMDNELWIMESKEGVRSVHTTSHGSEYVTDVSEIDDAIEEAQDSIDGLKKAKELLLEKGK
jgi:hypothetical protein